MGLLDKLKNALFEEEYVEVEEKPKTKESNKVRAKDLIKDKLKEEIEKNILAQKEMDAENKYIDALLEAVSKNVEVDIPEEMVEEEVDRLMGRFEEQIKMQGISLELYYQFTKSDEKALRSQMEKEAFKNVLYRLMLEEISKSEKMEVTEEEADKEALQ